MNKDINMWLNNIIQIKTGLPNLISTFVTVFVMSISKNLISKTLDCKISWMVCYYLLKFEYHNLINSHENLKKQ